MVCCCVPFCKEKQGKTKGLSFHEFPVNLELRKKWLMAIARKDFVPNSNSGSSKVCSKHFKTNDYVQTFKVKRLKPDAVPSVFEGYPEYMKRSTPVKRKGNEEESEITETSTEKKLIVPSIESPPSENISVFERYAKYMQGSTIESPPSENISVFERYAKYMQESTPVKQKRNKKESGITEPSTKKKLIVPSIESPPSENISIERKEEVETEKYKIKKLQSRLWKQNKSLQEVRNKFDSVKEELDNITNSALFKFVQKIFKDSNDSPSAKFLHDCIVNYNNKKPIWSESSIRECILFRHVSPEGYLHVKQRLINLPCRNTIKKYTESMVITESELIKERLAQEIDTLSESENFASFNIDEMESDDSMK